MAHKVLRGIQPLIYTWVSICNTWKLIRRTKERVKRGRLKGGGGIESIQKKVDEW